MLRDFSFRQHLISNHTSACAHACVFVCMTIPVAAVLIALITSCALQAYMLRNTKTCPKTFYQLLQVANRHCGAMFRNAAYHREYSLPGAAQTPDRRTSSPKHYGEGFRDTPTLCVITNPNLPPWISSSTGHAKWVLLGSLEEGR